MTSSIEVHASKKKKKKYSVQVKAPSTLQHPQVDIYYYNKKKKMLFWKAKTYKSRAVCFAQSENYA